MFSTFRVKRNLFHFIFVIPLLGVLVHLFESMRFLFCFSLSLAPPFIHLLSFDQCAAAFTRIFWSKNRISFVHFPHWNPFPDFHSVVALIQSLTAVFFFFFFPIWLRFRLTYLSLSIYRLCTFPMLAKGWEVKGGFFCCCQEWKFSIVKNIFFVCTTKSAFFSIQWWERQRMRQRGNYFRFIRACASFIISFSNFSIGKREKLNKFHVTFFHSFLFS